MSTPSVLVLNLLHEPHYKQSFNRRVQQVFSRTTACFNTLYLDDLLVFSQHLSSQAAPFTHLLISGSTQSTLNEQTWYAALSNIFAHFKATDKSVLGICFGHQFIIKHILGEDHVRKSPTPEMGWTNISLKASPLFAGLTQLKSGVIHYDEVTSLNENFNIIASSQRCEVQAYQLKNSLIWGVQFHPDFMYEDICSITQSIKTQDKSDLKHSCNVPTSPEEFSNNDLIFQNWLAITTP